MGLLGKLDGQLSAAPASAPTVPDAAPVPDEDSSPSTRSGPGNTATTPGALTTTPTIPTAVETSAPTVPGRGGIAGILNTNEASAMDGTKNKPLTSSIATQSSRNVVGSEVIPRRETAVVQGKTPELVGEVRTQGDFQTENLATTRCQTEKQVSRHEDEINTSTDSLELECDTGSSPRTERRLQGDTSGGKAVFDKAAKETSSGTSTVSKRVSGSTRRKLSQGISSETAGSHKAVLKAVLKELSILGSQNVVSHKPALDQDKGFATEDFLTSGVGFQRPESGRMSGLRGELARSHAGNITCVGEETKETERTEVGESMGSLQQRSGRLTGFRGEVMGERPESTDGGRSVTSRLGSGRTTGLRGELAKEEGCVAGRGTGLEEGGRASRGKEGGGTTGDLTDDIRHYTPRVGTAVLAKGHRPLLLGASGSDTCLLPEIGDHDTMVCKLGLVRLV